MLTFSAKTKQIFVNRARRHQEADEIVKGHYWDFGKGCAVGCLIHGSDHYKLAEKLGISPLLTHLIDDLFEGMSLRDAKAFPLRFVQAIPVRKNLALLETQWSIALLADPKHGVLRMAGAETKPSISAVVRQCKKRLRGEDSAAAWDLVMGAAQSNSYSSRNPGGEVAARAASAASWVARAARAAMLDTLNGWPATCLAQAAIQAANCFRYGTKGSTTAQQAHYLWMANTLISLLEAA